MKRLFLISTLMLVCAAAWAQPRNGLLVPPTLNGGDNQTPFIYLAEGNQFEYRITHSINGIPADPAFLRFTVTGEQYPVSQAMDFFILVQTYSNDKLVRQAQCYVRQQRGRIHLLGASNMGAPDCNWQAPFSQQDVVISDVPVEVRVGESSFSVPSTGTYEHYWGDQNGDNGFISFRYADGIGLYRFESRTSDSPLEPDQEHVEWLGELQYARIGGMEYGRSIIKERFEPADVLPELTPAQ